MTQNDQIPITDIWLIIGQKELTIFRQQQRIAALEKQLKDATAEKEPT